MIESIFSSYWYWLIAAGVLLILEILVPGIFLIWLGLGAALVSLFLLLFPDASLPWQLLVLVVSISLSVLVGLKWQRRLLRQQPASLNLGLEGLVGRQAEVSQAFASGRGRIKLEDTSYTALSDTAEMAVGQAVRIVAATANGAFKVQPLD